MGRSFMMMGSPPSMGAARWALRQIISYCGRIPETMLEKAQYLNEIKDPEKGGSFGLMLEANRRGFTWSAISIQFGTQCLLQEHGCNRKRNCCDDRPFSNVPSN
jgi:hypothetical protein